jgi:sec-independent protein translocase protein TatB
MDIHISEILLILLVALLVIKPERLPEVAFTLGRWIKRFQNVKTKMKNMIDQPMAKYSFHQPSKETVDE